MPIWEAIPKCPNAIFVKRDFRWYEVLSRKMLGVVRSISPLVEYYSIDEQFFVAGNINPETLQRDILNYVGVPVSIGIAPTKTLAKLISDSAKPFGCGVIADDRDRLNLLRDRPVTDITGIASQRAKRLAEYGVTTCEQFANADRRLIRRLLTKSGEDLWFELNGESVIPVLSARPEHKFISRGGSIGRASNDRRRIEAFIVRNVERLVEALAYYRLCCDKLILSLSFTDQPERSLRTSLLGSRADFEALLQAALYLLPLAWRPLNSPIHYMHVIAAGLRPTANRQRSLFEQPQLNDIKQNINNTVGRFAIRSGATLPLVDVYGDCANEYDICDIYGKSCF